MTEPTPRGRHHDISIVDTVSIESHVDRHSKHRQQAKTKPYREEWHGDDWNHDRQRDVRRDQVVDRERKRYRKRVVDPITGEEIRNVDEPLRDHRGRGAAKPGPAGSSC